MENKKNKGMILPFILIIFSVLSILGIVLLSVGGNESIQSAKQYNRTQAYYYAQSGAETFANYLVKASETRTTSDMEKLLAGVMNQRNVTNDLDNATIEIQVQYAEDKTKIAIISSAIYRNENSEVKVMLDIIKTDGEGSALGIPEKASLILLGKNTNTPLKMVGGGSIQDHVYINIENNSFLVLEGGGNKLSDGSLFIPDGKNIGDVTKTSWGTYRDFIKSEIGYFQENVMAYSPYNLPSFPTSLPKKGSFYYNDWNRNASVTLQEGEYTNFEFASEASIYLNQAVTQIKTDRLVLDHNLKFMNLDKNHSLKIYVEKEIIDNGFQLTHDALPENLEIYYKGTKNLQFKGDTVLKVNLYSDKANIAFDGGSNFNGLLSSNGKIITFTGGNATGNSVIYAPISDVIISAGGNITGTIIANRLETSGGITVKYMKSLFTLPNGSTNAQDESITLKFADEGWSR